jgi:hypothetical protein
MESGADSISVSMSLGLGCFLPDLFSIFFLLLVDKTPLKRQETDIHPLPVKTRKISIPSENIIPSEKIPQPLPWVGTLNQSHKKIIMDNKELCSDIICFAQSIRRSAYFFSQGEDECQSPVVLRINKR